MQPSVVHPLAIAHRAGNDLDRLRQARAAGVDLIEADTWLYRDRLEVRHLKTAGRLPVLWDRWALASAWAPRFSLGELLAAAGEGPELMLDLKGTDRRLPAAVLNALERYLPGRPVTVCSRTWELLKEFGDRPQMRVIHSVGSRSQFRSLARLAKRRDDLAVSIHQRLLTPAAMSELQELAALVITWDVRTPARMDELLALGVGGIISDDMSLLALLLRARTGAPRG